MLLYPAKVELFTKATACVRKRLLKMTKIWIGQNSAFNGPFNPLVYPFKFNAKVPNFGM